jgi:hypothetical protein
VCAHLKVNVCFELLNSSRLFSEANQITTFSSLDFSYTPN